MVERPDECWRCSPTQPGFDGDATTRECHRVSPRWGSVRLGREFPVAHVPARRDYTYASSRLREGGPLILLPLSQQASAGFLLRTRPTRDTRKADNGTNVASRGQSQSAHNQAWPNAAEESVPTSGCLRACGTLPEPEHSCDEH